MDGVGRASLLAKGLQSSAGKRGLYAVKNHVLHRKPTFSPEMGHEPFFMVLRLRLGRLIY
jgi:hypothetical protein